MEGGMKSKGRLKKIGEWWWNMNSMRKKTKTIWYEKAVVQKKGFAQLPPGF
jgi:hypothetical protein